MLWAIATSTKYPDVYVRRIKAASDREANEEAEKWYEKCIVFRRAYTYVVTKEINRD